MSEWVSPWYGVDVDIYEVAHAADVARSNGECPHDSLRRLACLDCGQVFGSDKALETARFAVLIEYL
jgi:hypothetical protein